MKTDEFMEEILAELSESGQIKITGVESPEEMLSKQAENIHHGGLRRFEDFGEEEEAMSVVHAIDNRQIDENEYESNVNEQGRALVSDEPMKTSAISSGITDKDEVFPPPVPAEYSGYKIVIHFSRFQLPPEHPVLKENPDLFDYQTSDRNHLYMIGHYESLEQARQALKSRVSQNYPQAYVAGFEKGIRTY